MRGMTVDGASLASANGCEHKDMLADSDQSAIGANADST